MVGDVFTFGAAEKTAYSKEVWHQGVNKGGDIGIVQC